MATLRHTDTKKMELRRIVGVMLLMAIVAGAWWYKSTHPTPGNDLTPDMQTRLLSYLEPRFQALESRKIDLALKQVETAVKSEDVAQARLDQKQALLPWKSTFYKVAGVSLLVTTCLAAGVLASAEARARLKRASVHEYRIGESVVVVADKDLSLAAPVAMGLINAEMLKQTNGGMAKALELYTTLADSQTNQLKALTGRRGLFGAALQDVTPQTSPALAPAAAPHVPTFRELWQTGELAPGKPLIFGFANGAPQYRTLRDVKALSVAGAQGSGKTLSTAYLTTAALLTYPNATAYVIDPHAAHEEGLGHILAPLAQTGRLRLVNPFDLASTIDALNAQLDRRLAGQEASDAPVLLVVDELARIGKTPLFEEKLLPFIERATEETRKANMLFVGSSQKWNARHFGNKADIRACIPSLLVHRIKPSQADLLVEDSAEKKLVKQLTRPGMCLLATSHDADPSVVTMPLLTPRDVADVAAELAEAALPADAGNGTGNGTGNALGTPRTPAQPVAVLVPVTDAEILAQIDAQIENKQVTLSGLAGIVGVNKGQLYAIVKRQKPIPAALRQRLLDYLAGNDNPTPPVTREETPGNAPTNLIPFTPRSNAAEVTA